MRLLGCDPGLTTGLSLITDGKIAEEVEVKSLPELWNMLHVASPDVLVVESFLGHGLGAEAAFEAIGICKLYAWEAGIELVYSNPSVLQGEKKPRGTSAHIWSARSHALHYLGKSRRGIIEK